MSIKHENGSEIPIRDRLPLIDVADYSVRCITSNLRSQDKIDWNNFHPVAGIGREGNLLLGKIESVGARLEMQYLHSFETVDVPLAAGDFIVGVLANRHSGTEEYGEIPKNGLIIGPGTDIDLISAGGAVGKCLGLPKISGDQPTRVKAVGLLADTEGKVADIMDFYPAWESTLLASAPIVLTLGTAAGIGKTTLANKLIDGLKSAGADKVAASKLAGTGNKDDIAALKQAGAYPAYDFPDVGLPTTYTSPDRYTPAIYTLLNKINREGQPDIIIAECGGDIIEGNIPVLLQDPNIMRNVVAIIQASTDVLSVIGSLALYEKWGILGNKPIYLTYPINRNYFATQVRLREQGINLPIFDPMNKEETAKIVRQVLSLL